MKRFIPLLALLAFAACFDTSSDAPPGDDDDDDVASNPTPTATISYGGYALVQRTRVDYTGGSSEQAYAQATFYEPIAAVGPIATVAPDTCYTPAPTPTGTATPEPVASLDAGATLTLSGSSSLSLPQMTNGSFLYYAPSGTLALTDVPPNGTWTVSWSGGTGLAAGSIPGELHSPATFTVTSPSFASPVVLSGDLPLTWTTAGAESGDFVWFFVSVASGSVTCRATDDGSFTIPGSYLATLGSGTGSIGGYRQRTREPLLPNGSRMFAYGIWAHYGPASKP